METIMLATMHVAIWVNLYFGSVWQAAVNTSNISKSVKFMFRAWLFFSVIMFLVSVVVLAGNAFYFLKRW